MFPTECRASAHSLSAIMGRFGAFAGVYWIDDFASLDGNTLYGSILYVAAALLAAILVLPLPETSGVKLDTDFSAINTSFDKDGNDRMPLDHHSLPHHTANNIHGDDEGDSDAMNVLSSGDRNSSGRGEEQSLLGKSTKPKNFPLGFK